MLLMEIVVIVLGFLFLLFVFSFFALYQSRGSLSPDSSKLNFFCCLFFSLFALRRRLFFFILTQYLVIFTIVTLANLRLSPGGTEG